MQQCSGQRPIRMDQGQLIRLANPGLNIIKFYISPESVLSMYINFSNSPLQSAPWNLYSPCILLAVQSPAQLIRYSFSISIKHTISTCNLSRYITVSSPFAIILWKSLCWLAANYFFPTKNANGFLNNRNKLLIKYSSIRRIPKTYFRFFHHGPKATNV